MRILLDNSTNGIQKRTEDRPDLVRGQLLTPLTSYRYWGGDFAIDNGAFSRFDRTAFTALLDKQRPHRDRCLFVACPDVVGNARRTLEVFDHWQPILSSWPVALVAQDGIDNLPIPWRAIQAVFIGGTDDFKESQSAVDVIKTAQLLGLHTHVGRINTPRRWMLFDKLGVDTCDGSGLSWRDDRWQKLVEHDHRPLFDLVKE